MKKLLVLVMLVSTLLIGTACSNEVANEKNPKVEELEKQITELKAENNRLKTEKAKLIKKIEAMQKKK
ncbi:hypothetical protein LCL95_10360 [Bacillus timonensis]|nr:hypothetical protein [Bacillus timonensis]